MSQTICCSTMQHAANSRLYQWAAHDTLSGLCFASPLTLIHQYLLPPKYILPVCSRDLGAATHV